jgi:hypothetical protein
VLTALGLEVFHNGKVGADTGVVFPVQQSGTFIPNSTAGFSGQATRTERISFNESLIGLRRDPNLRCEGRDVDPCRRLGGRPGIADLFEPAGRTRKVASLGGLTQLEDYNLDFIIKSNAGVEPRFTAWCRPVTAGWSGGSSLRAPIAIPRRSSSPW